MVMARFTLVPLLLCLAASWATSFTLPYLMFVSVEDVGLIERTHSAPDLYVSVALPSAMRTCPGVTLR